MTSVAIVIPIHKEFNDFSISEMLSLSRTIDVLSAHQFIFLISNNLHNRGLSDYLSIKKVNNVKFQKIEFNNFKSVEAYSNLLMSRSFYLLFKDFEYILICQLDVYVFSDMLDYWVTKQNIHYIGAPWFDYVMGKWTTNFMGVGNGGFSLRKVKPFIDFLTRVRIIFAIKEILSKSVILRRLSYKKIILRFNFYFKIKAFWELDKLFTTKYIPEDQYFGLYLSSIFSDFLLPNYEDSYKFSFETNPKYLYELNNFQFPFGCHAWEKYDSVFWAHHIKS
jgi:hypothetical protein